MVERLKDARSSHALTAAPMALDRALAESYAWELPPALRELEPLALLLEMNRRGAALEREGRAVRLRRLPADASEVIGVYPCGARQRHKT